MATRKKKFDLSKLNINTKIFIIIAIIIGAALVLSGVPQTAKFMAVPEVSTPFALNAWVYYGNSTWAPCDKFDGGKAWADGFCQGKKYGNVSSCYYQWANARWKPAGTSLSPIKGVATGAGGAMTKVRCMSATETCKDADGGWNLYAQGTCNSSRSGGVDVCISNTTLKEWSCTSPTGYCISNSTTCSTNKTCNSGRCI